jgi:hypothetical protein
MKSIVKFLSLILICCAGYFGYTGYQKMDKGDETTFIVDNKITVNVVETEEDVTFAFLNTSKESYNVTVSFGIKGDKNYTKGVDEIVISINNLVAYDKTFDITFDKDNFRKGTTYKNDKLGYATINIGSNVEVIEEYNYIHKVDVGEDGKNEKFHHGESMDYTYFIAAGGALLMAIVLFIKANGMPDPVKVEKPSKKNNKKKEEESLWNNEPTDDFNDVSYSSSNDTVRMTDEEKAKYLEGMQVIDMKKDELD